MPIEIRELVIRTRVEDSATGAVQGLPAASENGNGAGPVLSPAQIEMLVSIVLERLQEALRLQNER